ncbi:phosphatidylserine decarboxylase protein [Rutstroemia sp. NJR-2017a BBW]|nr:phosphatidylserine decarboxylase protein [Rutstroemia sp. NJR-2017a BBW]
MNTPRKRSHEEVMGDEVAGHFVAKIPSEKLPQRQSSSDAASVISSDPKPRDGKSVSYTHNGYQTLLRTMGVLLDSELAISEESDRFCQSLLRTQIEVPQDTLLGKDIYRNMIAELAASNKSRVIQDVGRLYVPSVQTLGKVYMQQRYLVFVESVNDVWDCCYPLTDPQPQPDYAVGFGRAGLSEARIKKLHPLIKDDPSFRSNHTSTYYMYFPFFSTEVTCGTSGLVVADRKNGHTMGVSVQSIVSLYRLAGKELELHNMPIAISVSHDHRNVILTGWGPVFDGDFYTVQPFPIHAFDVTALKGRELWTPFRFTIGVYKYGLTLLDKLNAVIDELPPDLNLDSVQPLKLGINPESEI